MVTNVMKLTKSTSSSVGSKRNAANFGNTKQICKKYIPKIFFVAMNDHKLTKTEKKKTF